MTACRPGCTCGKHSRVSTEERFWSKVDQADDCWLWNSATTRGYGYFWNGSKMVYAHRFAYELMVESVPDGHELDHRHTCPKHCVNPTHLRVVTSKQNKENQGGIQKNNLSGFPGVSWAKREEKWEAYVTHNYKKKHVGYFADKEEAGRAALAWRVQLFTHNDMDQEEI